MKSRTIEIIDNHIKALEEELEWYQERNREWQEKCEKLENRLDTFEANWGLAKHLNFAKSDQIQELRSENARLREKLRWHSVEETPIGVEYVLVKHRVTGYRILDVEFFHKAKTSWYFTKWCYIPDDNQGTDCTPEGE